MNRHNIILLEDNPERVRQFESAVTQLAPDYELHVWWDAERMMAECHADLADVALISLDRDLSKEKEDCRDQKTTGGNN